MILRNLGVLCAFGLIAMASNSGAESIESSSGKLHLIVRVGDQGTEKYCSGNKGDVCSMGPSEAKEYCIDQGLRLPSIMELALALNPGGVSETEGRGSYEVSPKGEATFYYTHQTYKPPVCDERKAKADWFERERCDEGKYWLWSSSNVPYARQYVLHFGGFNGEIHQYYRVWKHAIRCIGR